MGKFKRIPLSQGKFAIVDAEDFEFLNQTNWHFHKKPKDRYGYAVSRKGKMHRVVSKAKKGQIVDHINGKGLDNRKHNLRFVTAYQSAYNKNKTSFKKTKGCRGVSVVKDRKGAPKYWIARITKKGNRVYLGVFKNHIAASRAYIKASKEIHGEYSPWK